MQKKTTHLIRFFHFCFETPVPELIFELLSSTTNTKDLKRPPIFMSGISSQHDATTLLQLEVCLLIMEHLHKNDCKCRACYIQLTWGIIWEPWQILSFVHWPCGVNYVCCEKTRRAPWVRRTLVLACWSMAGMLISLAVLQTPNCNWSPLLCH